MESSMAQLAEIEKQMAGAGTEEEKKEWKESYDEMLDTVKSD
jgi:hypothetical protein